MTHIPNVKSNNGVDMPIIGGGAYADPDDPIAQGAVKGWIATALQAGYRHIDTALDYATEKTVGEAIKESGIPRKEFFVTTKLPIHHHHKVAESFNESLENLGLGYIDLYLMHWPQCLVLENQKDVTFSESWAEIEKLLDTGKVRAIGVSNFSVKTLEQLSKTAKIVPAVNQVEMHPYLAQNDLKKYCKEKGIAITAYTPSGYSTVRDNPVIMGLGKQYNATPNQIILSWHISHGIIVTPKSVNAERQKENLKKEDTERIDKLERNERLCNAADKNGSVTGWTYEQLGW